MAFTDFWKTPTCYSLVFCLLHCRLVACPVELDCPWNEQSANVSGYYSKKCDRFPQAFLLDNHPQAILLRWPPFYANDAVPQSMLGFTKTVHHGVSSGLVTLHEGTCRCNISLGHVPHYFHVCANVVILSLLHVAQCALHMFCRWPLVSDHLKINSAS